MKYIRLFENFRAYTPSDILNKILNTITSTKPICYMYEQKIIDNGDNAFYWILYEYTARSENDKMDKLKLYTKVSEEIKEKLEQFPEVEKVEIIYQGRFAPFYPDSKYGGGQKKKQCIFEVRCYLKKEYLDEIKLDYEIKDAANKYNL